MGETGGMFGGKMGRDMATGAKEERARGGAAVRVLRGHRGSVWGVSLSGDGRGGRLGSGVRSSVGYIVREEG